MTDPRQPDKSLELIALDTFGVTLEAALDAALIAYRESPDYPRISRDTRLYLARASRALHGFEASCLRWGVE